jgi:hypothetical protein
VLDGPCVQFLVDGHADLLFGLRRGDAGPGHVAPSRTESYNSGYD